MNILLTNEAGCFAPGVIELAKALSSHHRVVIVGPLSPQLNTGHWLTTASHPLRVKQYYALNKVKIFSVSGTPCDCVTLAIDKILLSKPDLIISGICNHYSHGEFIYSSGVTAAAVEGTIQGIPSIALSAKTRGGKDEKFFAKVARAFVGHLNFFMKNMTPNTTLNINYPEDFRPNKIICTHLTTKIADNHYDYEVNPFGKTYYWLKNAAFGFPLEALEQKGDIYNLKKGFITVTPLKLDLTSKEAIEVVENGGITL
ncbi:MAG: 5'/3'-nucleotidase SurE [Christensenellaceae bacterium]|jgi:5'-nucleotidase|nr:5'/3'-nucleotidase SurE [Christensenellaceae bacterium]